MASSCVLQRQAAGEQHGGPSLRFEDLPVEIIIELISHLDFGALDNMLCVNRRLKRIIEIYWSSVLPDIIDREFSPAEAFFEVLRDVPPPLNGQGRAILSERDKEVIGIPQYCLSGLSSVKRLHAFLSFCRIVKRWEIEFQRLRFFEHPEHIRSLHPHERQRLRQGLYAWWRFARYFHGGGGQFGHNDPPMYPERSANTPGLRRGFMQQMSSTQLHELHDVWETVRSAVGREVCPSVVAVREWSGGALSRVEATRIGWGDPPENEHILATMMKLHPEDILHLLVYRHRYATKGSVIQFVRFRHPRIEDGVETFTEAILDVMRDREDERLFSRDTSFFPLVSGYPSRYGGILDHHKTEAEELRIVYSNDAGLAVNRYPQLRDAVDRFMVVGAPMGKLVASL